MNTNLKTLLLEYEQKRSQALTNARQQIAQLYNDHPDIEKLDNDINSYSIKNIQAILTSKNKKEINSYNKKLSELKKERQNLLKKYNYSNSDLKPKFACSKCNDTGYISTSSGNILCSCIKQRLYNIAYNDSNIYDLEHQNFDNFEINLYSDKPDEDKYHSKLSPRENILLIKDICHNFINNFDDPSENNLLFCGNTGLGKSFLSSCIANELIKKEKTVLYQTAPIMLDKILDYKFGKTDNNILDSIYSVDLLIIDDLGSESSNSLKLTELFNIINSRLLNQNNKITKTIISTNLSLQELYKTYEERIVSRIIGHYNACYFFGEDIRIKKKVGIN